MGRVVERDAGGKPLGPARRFRLAGDEDRR
jgi:hypothetical protein